ncbi:MAG: DUF3592 domain-containing protein [Clostridiales bacterium]|nr:DUF3592 domain-containing protein [Clostridiales bacterium]
MSNEFLLILIFCSVTLILVCIGILMLVLGRKIFGKYLTQEKTCTSHAVGKVVGYSNVVYSDVFRYPIVEFTAVDGNTYKVQGPEYKTHAVIKFDVPLISNKGFNVEEDEEKQKIVIKHSLSEDCQFFYGENPLEYKYPLGSELDVYYDPSAPAKGFVKRYCDKKFMYKIFKWIAIGLFAAACLVACSGVFVTVMTSFFG